MDRPSSRPRVCHITSLHPVYDTRIFLKECVSLANAGFETYLVAPRTSDHIKANVHILGVPEKATTRWRRFAETSVRVVLRAWKTNADIYHFHDPSLLPIAPFLKLKGARVVYDSHEDLPKQTLTKDYIYPPIRKLISVALDILETIVAKVVDAVVAATPAIAERFQNKTKVVIDVNNYPLLDEFAGLTEGWNNKEQAVCYVGNIDIIRGLKEMVSALQYTKAKLYLAGPFPQSEDLRRELVQNPGWRQVIEMGYVDRREMAGLLGKSIAGLTIFHPAPNHVEALPNKLFEYMSAGIPVIASNFPLWKSIVETNRCGICVNPLDPKEIANAINWFLEHPKDAEEMGQNARRLVKDTLNWNSESVKLTSLYKQLLS